MGNPTISGTASVALPFSIVAGGSYTLATGQSQAVTVRYAPTATGTHVGYVSFSGGGGATRQVTGSAFNDPLPTTGTIAGRVTRSDTHAALNGVAITAVGPGSWFDGSAGAMSGVRAGQAGSFSISGLPPFAHYHVLATSSGQQFDFAELTEVSVLAGQTTTLNIELVPVPSPSQPPTLTAQETPVVLVRGRGTDKDWAAGESDYWAEFRSALVGQGFQQVWDCNQPDNDDASDKNPKFPVYSGQGHVINGEKSIQENGWSLQYYVRQKAEQFNREKGDYPPVINIVAHSMGGLITRSAMLDGSFSLVSSAGEWVRIKVNKVVMLGTPNAGASLADAAILNGVPLWPWQWESTRDLKTSNIRVQFNPSHPWPSEVMLFLLGGGGGGQSSDSSYQRGNWYIVNNSVSDAEWANDGAVSWPSVQGISYEKSKSGALLVEKHTFNGRPAASPQFEGSLDHTQIHQESAVATWVIGALKGTLASGLTKLSNGPVTRSNAPQLPDAGTNSLLMQQIEQLSSTLLPGLANEVAVVSDASTKLQFVLFAGATNVVFRLKDPGETVIDSTTPASNTNVQYSTSVGTSNTLMVTYTINNPAAGVWKMVVDGTSVTTTPAVYSLMVFGDSEVALIPQTGALFNQGQDVGVNCALADLGTDPAAPVKNAAMTALVQLPDGTTTSFTLLDDGLHSDGGTDDGVYGAVLANVQQAGDYLISYRATATDTQSRPLQRVARGTLSVSSGSGALWGDPVYETIDTNADGLGDFLQVKCWVNPIVAGNAILSGELVNADGTQRFAKSSQFSSDGSGPIMVTLMFDMAEIRAAAGEGKFHIENLRLFEVKSAGAAWLDTYHGSSEVQIGSAKITLGFDGSNLHLSWPVNCLGWELQTQIDSLGLGLGTNWSPVPGSTNNMQMSFPIDPASPGRFYRLHFQ